MKESFTWFVLAVGILFCGAVCIIQFLLFLGGRGSGSLALFFISAIPFTGLVLVAVLRIRRGRKFWE
jgi:hypothetical protein